MSNLNFDPFIYNVGRFFDGPGFIEVDSWPQEMATGSNQLDLYYDRDPLTLVVKDVMVNEGIVCNAEDQTIYADLESTDKGEILMCVDITCIPLFLR